MREEIMHLYKSHLFTVYSAFYNTDCFKAAEITGKCNKENSVTD